ncbi:type II toxin-antitoxin system HipA family toxin [Ekhidna sp.]
MKSLNQIKVGLQFDKEIIPVGRLAIRDSLIYFEYDRDFLEMELNISPIRMSFEPGLQTFDPTLFEGLPGVFNDSLPDGWGRLLLDRFLKSKNLLPQEFSSIDRLAHVGKNGLGALIYEPDQAIEESGEAINLDALAEQSQEVLKGGADEVLQELIDLNGSSAGARPKALIGIDQSRKQIIHGRHDLLEGFEHWIVKFPNSGDGVDAGAIEYVYALMAKEAGIAMTDAHLFSSSRGAGYFAIKRFDRSNNKRLHMHTASGLLHANFRIPSLDYEDIATLTGVLTKDLREVEKLFRLAVFNVLSHNRDDHGKNFSFLMDDLGEWKLSPAYDLTFSSGPGGHQSTMVMGEGQNPKAEHLIKLGLDMKLNQSKINDIIDQVCSALNKWDVLANEYAVSASSITLVKERMSKIK